jgi:hypothetical protein
MGTFHRDAIAKLVTVRGEELCVVRGLSRLEARIQVYSNLKVGEKVRIVLGDGAVLTASVTGYQDSIVALRLQGVSDALPAGDEGLPPAAPLAPRLPRLDVGLPISLRVGDQQGVATLCNISQGGAKIRASGLGVGVKVSLLVGGLPPLAGRVRWVRDDFAGMAFYQLLPLETLASWSAALAALAPRSGQPASDEATA